jgi:hypothetical protein
MSCPPKRVKSISDQSGKVLGGSELLVDDEVPFAGTGRGYRVDGQDDLFVSSGTSQVGESVGETRDDYSTAGGM